MYYPPFPPGPPSPYYPPASVRLGFWALRKLVKQLPPPQSWAEYHYVRTVRPKIA
jgi:hypothetical protein